VSKNFGHQWKSNPIMDWPQGYISFQEKMGWFYKKGCRIEFTVKTLYLFKHVSKLCFIQQNHINQEGLHVHEDLKMGGIYIFVVHLSQQIKDFVMEKLKLGFTMSQIMAKHKEHVKNIMLVTCELNKYMFIIE
jgi:hypothetical protein